MPVLFGYLSIINALGLALMCADKQKARKKRRRIPEAALLSVAALGGSLGSAVGMILCRHKTLHPRFAVGVPLLLLLHLCIVGYLALRWLQFLP